MAVDFLGFSLISDDMNANMRFLHKILCWCDIAALAAPSVLDAACEWKIVIFLFFLGMSESLKRNKTLLGSIFRCTHHTSEFLIDIAVLTHIKHSWCNLHGGFSLGSFVNCHDYTLQLECGSCIFSH